ncbi:MAG TPA: queuosine precursor transporter [Candidatus Saccharimonadales bacterium]
MSKNDRPYVLVGLYIFCIIVSELMGGKTFNIVNISWLTLNASVAIFVVPLLFTITDVITEVYGKESARKLVRFGLIIIAMLLVAALLFSSLPPSSRYSSTEKAYDTIFGTSIRFGIASIVAFAVSEFLDVAIFSKLKQRMMRYGLWFRNNVSNIASQFIDSAVFLSLAFYAPKDSLSANLSFIFSLLLPYWILRCLFSFAETPLVYIGVNWLKRSGEANDKLEQKD